jgi:hypothetical protein
MKTTLAAGAAVAAAGVGVWWFFFREGPQGMTPAQAAQSAIPSNVPEAQSHERMLYLNSLDSPREVTFQGKVALIFFKDLPEGAQSKKAYPVRDLERISWFVAGDRENDGYLIPSGLLDNVREQWNTRFPHNKIPSMTYITLSSHADTMSGFTGPSLLNNYAKTQGAHRLTVPSY